MDREYEPNERKFLVRLDPKILSLKEITPIEIVQAYLTAPGSNPAVRVRREGKKLVLTAKRTDPRNLARRSGVNLTLTEEEASALFLTAGESSVQKERYVVGRWEIDVFQGKLQDLIVAEIELEEYEELPLAPEGVNLVIEVTQEPQFSNQNLAGLSFNDARRFIEKTRQRLMYK